MNYEIKENNKKEAVLEISVSQEEFEAGLVKSFNKNKSRFAVPGFRKGKATRKMVEKYYGEGVLYDDAINFVLPDAYDEAVEKSGLEVVSRPEIDLVSIGDGNGFTVTARVVLKPEVTLKKYKGIKAEKTEYNYTKEEVEAEISNLREKTARKVEVEDRAVVSGDIVNINYEGFCDGVAFEGGKGENYDLTIGSNTFIPGFEEKIIGHSKDEEFDIDVTFPEEYHAEALKGKAAIFKIKINKITVKEYAELDDEFAKDVSEFDTIKELRESIEGKLKKNAEQRTKNEFENKVLEAIVKENEVEVPDCMADEKCDQLVEDYKYRLSQQGLDFNMFLQYTGQTVESFREQHMEEARDQVKLVLILEAIAKKEKIDVEDSEIDAKIAEMAESYKMEAEQLKSMMNVAEFKKEIVLGKVVEFVVAEASGEAPKKTAAKKTTKKAEEGEEKPAKKTAAKKTTKKAEEGEEKAAKKPAAKKTTKKAAEGEEKPVKKTTAKKTTKKAEEKSE